MFVNFGKGKGDEAVVSGILDGSAVNITNNNITALRSAVFHSYANLNSVCFKNCKQIGSSAFNACSSLVNVDMPLLGLIGVNAFNSCKKLVNIKLPTLCTLQAQSFVNCINLSKIIVNAATIIDSALLNCQSLTSVILTNNNVATLSSVNAFTNTPIANGTGHIYVPAVLLEDYKTATNWVTYADQFRAIEDYPEVLEVSSND